MKKFGTTGLTLTTSELMAIDFDRVDKAARWLATTRQDQRPHPLVPHICKTFGLTLPGAITAIREANLIRARAN